MGLIVLAGGEERLVGGDKRDAARIGELDQRRLGQPFRRDPVALQFDVQAVAEQTLQRFAARQRERALAAADREVERPARTAGERNQAVRFGRQPGELDVRLLGRRRFQIGARAQPHQAAVALLARSQKHEARPCLAHRGAAFFLVAEIDAERTADDRLDAGARHLLGELERSEHVVGVGQRQCGLTVLLGEVRQAGDGQRPFQQRIGGVHVQVHKARFGCGGHAHRYSRVAIPKGSSMRERRRRCPCRASFRRSPRTGSLLRRPTDTTASRRGAGSGAAKPPSSLDQITPSTCAQTATIAMNKAMEASAPASSTTARTMMLPPELERKGNIVHLLFSESRGGSGSVSIVARRLTARVETRNLRRRLEGRSTV